MHYDFVSFFFLFLFLLFSTCILIQKMSFIKKHSRLNISKQELEPFALIEPNKNYTRNLIATDDETFTLLLLCWNPGKYSPVHDHPCNGCWMRVCQGVVNEVRYEKKEHTILPPIEEDDADNGTKVCDDDVTFSSSSSPSPISTSFECTEDTTFKEGEQTYIHDNLGYHKVSFTYIHSECTYLPWKELY
mmetsp:Transcript_33142/g.38595  ORF Transcript_33142/g.38595 Transcript_33142/m.38595 type:complete len:189 (-) Transcript_33142:131-697(-)